MTVSLFAWVCLCCTLQECHAVLFVMDHKIAKSRMQGLVFFSISSKLHVYICMLSEDYIRTQHRTP